MLFVLFFLFDISSEIAISWSLRTPVLAFKFFCRPKHARINGCGHARERRSCEPRTRRRPIHPEPLGRPRHGNPRHIAHQSGTGTSTSQGYEALYTPSQRPARAGRSEWGWVRFGRHRVLPHRSCEVACEIRRPSTVL